MLILDIFAISWIFVRLKEIQPNTHHRRPNVLGPMSLSPSPTCNRGFDSFLLRKKRGLLKSPDWSPSFSIFALEGLLQQSFESISPLRCSSRLIPLMAVGFMKPVGVLERSPSWAPHVSLWAYPRIPRLRERLSVIRLLELSWFMPSVIWTRIWIFSKR